MDAQCIKNGDLVIDARRRLFRVVRIDMVFGIPAADLVRVNQRSMRNGSCLRTKNLPLSCLELVTVIDRRKAA